MYKIKLLISCVFAFLLINCNDQDVDFNITENDVYNATNIFPQPPSQWMGTSNPYFTEGYVGDVMPYYENGKFHMFFLHDAKSKPANAGIHDIHSFETSDFINYSYNGRQIPYGNSTDADFAVGTGSLIKSGGTYYYFYTGHNATSAFLAGNPRESILLATSTDMKNWSKITDFKITAPQGYYDFEFRDPHVMYNQEENKYWMLVSAQTDDRRAVVLKFTTTDLASGDWSVESPIYTSPNTENYIMLECPDLFKMGDYWYLVFSENWSDSPGTKYRYSSSPNGPWVKPENDQFDGSYFYAAKTVSDGTNRFITGWTARKAPENNTGAKEWAGNMMTHQLVQNSNGTLGVKPLETLSSVFTNEVALTLKEYSGSVNQSGNNFSLGATSKATFDALRKSNKISFQLQQNTGLAGIILAEEGNSEKGVKIEFNESTKELKAYTLLNGTETLMNHHSFAALNTNSYDVNLYISNNICVVYINDLVAFSVRLYDIAGKKWSFYSINTASFNKVILKNSQK